MNRRVQVLSLVAVTGLLHLGSLRPGFIHDDHRIVEQNDRVTSPPSLGGIFSAPYWPPGTSPVSNLYRPVTILSFSLERAVHGLHPFGFRLTNLLLHVLNTLLVFLLATRLLAAPEEPPGWCRRPLLAALLFAVHPIHTEVLGEIVGRAELLAAAGALGSVLAFLKMRESGGGAAAVAGLGGLSLALCAAAFLAKENAVVVPALLLCADILLVGRRPAWGFHAAAWLGLAALLAARFRVLGGLDPGGGIHFVDNPIPHLPFLEGRLTALKVLARYAGLLVWPGRLSIDYSFRTIPPASGPLDAGAILGAALLIAWGGAAVHACSRARGQAFAILWIGLAMAPVANLLFPIGTIMAERLLYLPSVGFCIAVVPGLTALLAWRPRPHEARGAAAPRALSAGSVGTSALVILLLLALSTRSFARLKDWSDDYTIFKAAVRVVPDSVRAQFNYGSACEERGVDDAAAGAYEKALAVWPDFADAHYNLAGVLARRSQWQAAVAHYREAVRLEPGNVRALVNLGHALNALGEPGEARDVLRRAAGIDSGSAEAFTNLGAAELMLHDAPAAVAAYREALRLDPGNADYLRNLGLAQREAGDGAAAATFRSALARRPGDPELLYALGLALLDARDGTAAEAALRQAVASRPGHPGYHYQHGRALQQTGDAAGALAEFRESIRLAPNVPLPYRELGLLLDRQGDAPAALEALERATALDRGGVMDEASRKVLARLRGAAKSRPAPPATKRSS